MNNIKVIAASEIEIDREALDASIQKFTGRNNAYYADVFHRIHEATSAIPRTFNIAAAIFGPTWAAMRGIWGMFWGFLILEVIAWVQIGRGSWGDLGASDMARVEKFANRVVEMREKAEVAKAAGQDPSVFEGVAENMLKAMERARQAAEAANADATMVLLTGIVILALVKIVQGAYANKIYESQYSRWRVTPTLVESGVKPRNLVFGILLVVLIAPLTIYRFTTTEVPVLLKEFPEKQISSLFYENENETLFSHLAIWMEGEIDAAAIAGAGVFDSVVVGVRWVLNALTISLIKTPWPVVMAVIFVVAWRSAGPRVAIFTAASLAYISLLGYWETSMETVALVGAAVLICVTIGIPLGIWFGKSKRAYRGAEPVLDLMQTLPAFVYLIPIIAFFGTGNPPGILATIIFGMPPVIRLTALGMKSVPHDIKEAAVSFGASRWQLLRDVEIPLALPSIMAGVNQTILMCLSMVVIISLIGGGGLGKEILEALQYAAKGPGLLGGFAILFCAMVMDRIAQGAFRRKDQQ
jgi:glycine betaine/proline transport system permease protein